MTLTEAGRRVIAAFHAQASTQLDALVDQLAATERKRLRRSLARITEIHQAQEWL